MQADLVLLESLDRYTYCGYTYQEDLVLLESLDRPLMAYCLRHRYQEDKIYTWVGADHTVLTSPSLTLQLYAI